MPTITIKNGARTLKLTKRETETLMNARAVCLDIADDFAILKTDAENANNGLRGILCYLANDESQANGKPQPPEAGK